VNGLVSQVTHSSPPRMRSTAPVDSYRRLADVFHEVLSEETHVSVLERIADTLADILPYDAFTIYQLDESRRLLIPVMARDRWAEEVMSDRPLLGEGITGWAIDHGEPQLVNDAHLDPRVKQVPGTTEGEPEALISVPLVARGSVKGALNVYRLGPGARFSEEDFELAKRFGDAAALALDNAQARAVLELQAQTDSLTGLYNHRYFHDRLRAELNRASRTHDSIAVLMLDIDDFKRVNDVHGHGAGDQVLLEIAELLQATVRTSDVVCRLGGEEFGVVMASCDAGDAIGWRAGSSTRWAEPRSSPRAGSASRSASRRAPSTP
jgi:GGDEF domain-containing protein/putative methionine-R-sulfoxide reductase with GAF domain